MQPVLSWLKIWKCKTFVSKYWNFIVTSHRGRKRDLNGKPSVSGSHVRGGEACLDTRHDVSPCDRLQVLLESGACSQPVFGLCDPHS